MLWREVKPKSVSERGVEQNCAPECEVTRTRSRFMCSETSLMSVGYRNPCYHHALWLGLCYASGFGQPLWIYWFFLYHYLSTILIPLHFNHIELQNLQGLILVLLILQWHTPHSSIRNHDVSLAKTKYYMDPAWLSLTNERKFDD